MKHLHHLFTILAMLTTIGISASSAQGSWPHTFFVGANHVRCDLPTGDLDTWPNYIQAVDSSTVGWQSWQANRSLPDQRFIQLQDLGLNLAEFTIDPDSLPMPE
jgi:hypothetical protein